jgi:hypothetical protein
MNHLILLEQSLFLRGFYENQSQNEQSDLLHSAPLFMIQLCRPFIKHKAT